MTDAELATQSISSTWLFGELIKRYEEPLGRYIARLGVRNFEDRQDILQDVFIKVYRALNSYDVTRAFSSWIYRIAHNVTMSFFSKKSSRPEGHVKDLEDEDLFSIADSVSLMEELEREGDDRVVANAVNKLDSKYRSVIILHYFEHQSYEEISDILHLPPGTVATNLSRAKKKLAEIIPSL